MKKQDKQTGIALVWDGERFYISLTEDRWNRGILHSENNPCDEDKKDRDKKDKSKKYKSKEYNPYELFINNRRPSDMVKAVDELAVTDFQMIQSGFMPIAPFSSSAARKLASLYSEKPTRTDVRNAQELIDKWGVDNRANDIPYMWVDFQSLIRASRDLNAACKLLLYSIDECPEEFVQELLSDFPQLRKEGAGDLVGAYYESLRRSQSDANFEYLFEGKKVVGYRAKKMFNTLLSGTSLEIALFDKGEISLLNSSSDALVVIWTYFAEMMQKSKVTVCATCERIFIRKRKTGKYCSRPCSVTASKNK